MLDGESIPDKDMFGETHSGMASEMLRTSLEILGFGRVVFENLVTVTLKISPACDSGNVCGSVKDVRANCFHMPRHASSTRAKY